MTATGKNKKRVAVKKKETSTSGRFGMFRSKPGALHNSFRLTSRKKADYHKAKMPKLVSTAGLFKKTLLFIKKFWKLIGGLTLVYLFVTWLAVGLPDGSAYTQIKEVVDSAVEGNITSATGIGTLLLGAATGLFNSEQSELAQFLTGLLSLIFFLIFIWTVRHLMAGNETTIRQALYNAPAPLISSAIVLLVLVLQLLPGALGLLLISYSSGFQDVVVSGGEAALFVTAGLLLILLTVYLILPTLLAMIIVSLPNVYPLAAINSAGSLVEGRRLSILLRLIGLVVLLSFTGLLLLVPIIAIDASLNVPLPLVPAVIDILTICSLPVISIYLYHLYRELL